MNQRGRFYSNEEPPPENLRQLEEDVDSDTEVELNENEINIKGEANIVEEVMNGIIPENSINNTTQRDDESSDESEDDYCVNEKPCIKVAMELCGPKVHPFPYRDAEKH